MTPKRDLGCHLSWDKHILHKWANILHKCFSFDSGWREELGNIDNTVLFVFQPIFTMSAQQSQLKVMDQQNFNKFIQAFSRDTVSKSL